MTDPGGVSAPSCGRRLRLLRHARPGPLRRRPGCAPARRRPRRWASTQAAFDAELTATVHERFSGAGGTVEGSLAWVARPARRAPVGGAAGARRRGCGWRSERGFGEPRPEAVPVLRALRERGLRVGLVSDCSAELPTYFPDLPIAPYVDAPVFSFVTGHRKPAPENYLACCAALGVEPAECLYVGDGGSERAGRGPGGRYARRPPRRARRGRRRRVRPARELGRRDDHRADGRARAGRVNRTSVTPPRAAARSGTTSGTPRRCGCGNVTVCPRPRDRPSSPTA